MADEARMFALEEFRRYAKEHMLGFLQWCWWMPPDRRPLRIGRHTRALCERFDRAIEDFKDGKSTYLIVNMPFRHGKSDLVSRALPAYFLGRCAEYQPDVIMSGYGTSLVKGFSAKAQTIIGSEAYQRLYPGVRVDPIHCAKEEWCVEGSQGLVTAQGLGGSITGKGGNLIIIDDYCRPLAVTRTPVILCPGKPVKPRTVRFRRDAFFFRTLVLRSALLQILFLRFWGRKDFFEVDAECAAFSEIIERIINTIDRIGTDTDHSYIIRCSHNNQTSCLRIPRKRIRISSTVASTYFFTISSSRSKYLYSNISTANNSVSVVFINMLINEGNLVSNSSFSVFLSIAFFASE